MCIRNIQLKASNLAEAFKLSIQNNFLQCFSSKTYILWKKKKKICVSALFPILLFLLPDPSEFPLFHLGGVFGAVLCTWAVCTRSLINTHIFVRQWFCTKFRCSDNWHMRGRKERRAKETCSGEQLPEFPSERGLPSSLVTRVKATSPYVQWSGIMSAVYRDLYLFSISTIFPFRHLQAQWVWETLLQT